MIMLLLFRMSLSAAATVPWMLGLATRMVARLLNIPEPLLHHTGAFVLAQMQAVENSVGQILYPVRWLRQLLSWLASGAPVPSSTSPQGELP